MERRDLQHLADFLCGALADSSLLWDYQLLAELGRGVLWIDVLGAEAFYNGQPLPRLFARQRLRSDLHMEAGGDPQELLDEATLKVRFATRQHGDQEDLSTRWDRPTGRFVTCTLQLRSRVGQSGVTVTGLHTEILEWPFPFRLAGAEVLRPRLDDPPPASR